MISFEIRSLLSSFVVQIPAKIDPEKDDICLVYST